MAGQRFGRYAERLCRPRERNRSSVQLSLACGLSVEVSFADHQEMTPRIVARGGVPGEVGRPQFEDVAVAVHAQVIGDVNPALVILMVGLMLAKP